jgi:SnoaL-like domain
MVAVKRNLLLRACILLAAALTGTAAAQNTDSLEARVADLEAREAIRNLIYEYGRALDHRDFVSFSRLFEEEGGTWEGGMGVATGRQAIFELMDSTIGHADEPVEPRSHHVFTNIQIKVDGAKATATTKWIFVVPSESGDPRWQFLGHYDDEFVRMGGEWLFLRRKAFTDIPVQ